MIYKKYLDPVVTAVRLSISQSDSFSFINIDCRKREKMMSAIGFLKSLKLFTLLELNQSAPKKNSLFLLPAG